MAIIRRDSRYGCERSSEPKVFSLWGRDFIISNDFMQSKAGLIYAGDSERGCVTHTQNLHIVDLVPEANRHESLAFSRGESAG